MIAFVFIYINLLSGKIGFKSILLLILGVVAIAIGLQYLSDINGEGNLDVLTSKEGFEEYATMTSPSAILRPLISLTKMAMFSLCITSPATDA